MSCIQAHLGIIINIIYIVTAFGDDCLPCLLLKLAEFCVGAVYKKRMNYLIMLYEGNELMINLARTG